jgi:hypothetical protein
MAVEHEEERDGQNCGELGDEAEGLNGDVLQRPDEMS